MRIHLEHVRTSFGAIAIKTRQRIANVRFIGCTHGSCREQPLFLEGLAKFNNHFGLLVLETATFLVTVSLPPACTWLVERLNRTERDAPFFLEVLRYFREVIGEIVKIIRLEIVGSIDTARNTTAICHPPRRGIGKRFKNRIFRHFGKSKSNISLALVCRPVVIAFFGWLVAGDCSSPIALGQVVMAGLVATADIVAENIIAKTRVRIGNCAQKLFIIRFAPFSSEFSPPAKACSPAFKKLILFTRVHNDFRLRLCRAASKACRDHPNQFTLQLLNPVFLRFLCAIHHSLKIHYFTEKRTSCHKKLLMNCHFPA